MNSCTKDFLLELSKLMDKYSVKIQLEGDSYYDGEYMDLSVENPVTFDEHFVQWVIDNPEKEYPWEENLYSSLDLVNMGSYLDKEKVIGLIK